MNWKVTLDFKGSASFGPMLIAAADKAEAIAKAVREAASFGYDAPVKKARAIPQ